MLPVVLLVGVVLLAAVTVAVMNQKAKAEEEAGGGGGTSQPEQRVNPFADIDNSPPSRGGKAMTNRAAEGLDRAQEFAQGRALAAEAKELLAEAATALEKKDDARWRELSLEARGKFDEALIVTADWSLGIIEQYGDDDIQVARINKEIETWSDQLRKLRFIK